MIEKAPPFGRLKFVLMNEEDRIVMVSVWIPFGSSRTFEVSILM